MVFCYARFLFESLKQELAPSADRKGKAVRGARTVLVVLLGLSGGSACAASAVDARADSLRRASVAMQRQVIWDLWAQMTRSSDRTGLPAFEHWHGEEDVFSRNEDPARPRGIRGFRRSSAALDAGAPVITYTLYNDAAYRHIRGHQLYLRSTLERLRRTGESDKEFPADRTVPSFPQDSLVVKTAWWPVAAGGMTPLPVWDPEFNPALRGGNGYLSWKRVLRIVSAQQRGASLQEVEFAGRHFSMTRDVPLDSLYHVTLDRSLAARLSKDANAAKMSAIVLGRALREGDSLVLVGVNLASRVIEEWAWASLWWHDAPEAGPFATGRPPAVTGWRRAFLMDAAFDSNRPAAAGGSPHVCFNPWLEARFPDGGQGGGTVSNCMTCHRRAAYPATAFLPVTRGNPDSGGDPAFAAGLVRTSFLWALAEHGAADPGR